MFPFKRFGILPKTSGDLCALLLILYWNSITLSENNMCSSGRLKVMLVVSRRIKEHMVHQYLKDAGAGLLLL